MLVWIADHGLADELAVISAHPSAEAAADHIRGQFREPFAVDWDPLAFSPDGEQAVLAGVYLGGEEPHPICVLLQRWDVTESP